MNYVLDLDMDRCIGCGACAVACMDQHDTDLEAGEAAFRWVADVEARPGGALQISGLSVACMHCQDAPCVTGCPVGCLQKDPETGMTVVNAAHCIGCHSCAMACPFGAPKFDDQGKIAKCDGCADRIKQGRLPACVQVCPTSALTLKTQEEIRRERGERTLHRVLGLLE